MHTMSREKLTGSRLSLHSKLIAKAAAWSNRALGDTRSAIHPVGPVLIETMPVNGRRVDSLVLDIDHDSVSFVAADQFSGELAIDGQKWTIYTVRVTYDLPDSPVELADLW